MLSAFGELQARNEPNRHHGEQRGPSAKSPGCPEGSGVFSCQRLLRKCLQYSVTLLFYYLPEELLSRGLVWICVSGVIL